MAGLLSNTLTNFTRRTVDTYSVMDYKSINMNSIYDYINTLSPDTFDWYQVQDDDKWERISLELYQNTDYWDVLLILNQRNPLTDLPFSFDVISKLSEDRITEYHTLVYGSTLPTAEHDIMLNIVETNNLTDNENNRVIKIIKPAKMSRFLQDGYDLGIF